MRVCVCVGGGEGRRGKKLELAPPPPPRRNDNPVAHPLTDHNVSLASFLSKSISLINIKKN